MGLKAAELKLILHKTTSQTLKSPHDERKELSDLLSKVSSDRKKTSISVVNKVVWLKMKVTIKNKMTSGQRVT